MTLYTYIVAIDQGDFYKSPRRGGTFNNTVYAVRQSAVTICNYSKAFPRTRL